MELSNDAQMQQLRPEEMGAEGVVREMDAERAVREMQAGRDRAEIG